ncbi:uncharacterized protein LOC141610533 isoform X2 [Silene latifolia]|uniref:uncharacterized protein LOC141610533 isoform X2 n=1 Tax=Silene latifolia TaxID=37657 RepID=UPI003D77DD83
MSLPALVVFSVSDSNNEVRYLSFTGPQRQLRCGIEEGVFSDTAKFAVESAGDGLVHIRSCYDNYYWTRASRFEPWLLALAPEKVEDMSKEDCTLFRPRMSAGNVFVGFAHVQSGLNVVMRPATDAHAYHLCVEQAPPTDFSFLNFAPLTRTKLPRYIMFLGDNNKYLSPSAQRPLALLHFAEFDNPTSRAVGFEVMYTKSGDLRIKSMSLNEFWDAKPPSRLVVIDTATESSDPNDPNTLFDVALSSPPNTREVGMALRCRGYNLYVQRWLRATADCVVAANTPHLYNAWLRPRHPAIQDKRRVNIDNFRHAWVGPSSTRRLRERYLTNTTNVERETAVFTETYRENTRITLNSSIGFFRGPAAVFNGRMPSVLATGELEIPDEAIDVTASWGTVRHTWVDDKKHDYSVKIPPMSAVTLTLFVKIATYEVPFSYQQIDESPFGGTITQDLYDGVFRIEAEYGIEEQTSIRPFTSSEVVDGKISMEEQDIKYADEEANVQDGIGSNAVNQVEQESQET